MLVFTNTGCGGGGGYCRGCTRGDDGSDAVVVIVVVTGVAASAVLCLPRVDVVVENNDA